jgi:activating signal cointegrator complex subunit 2
VDSATPGNNPEEQLQDADSNTSAPHDEALFRAFKMSPDVFGRDAATRRGKGRQSLKEETGMTDEAIEGWAVMLGRDPRKMRRLEARFSAFTGSQTQLASTSWRGESGEDDDGDGGVRGRGGFRGRGGGGGGRRGRGAGGRGRGNVAGPTGERETEVARQRKEANKGSRANHNRRDQRAKKMARGGFPG